MIFAAIVLCALLANELRDLELPTRIDVSFIWPRVERIYLESISYIRPPGVFGWLAYGLIVQSLAGAKLKWDYTTRFSLIAIAWHLLAFEWTSNAIFSFGCFCNRPGMCSCFAFDFFQPTVSHAVFPLCMSLLSMAWGTSRGGPLSRLMLCSAAIALAEFVAIPLSGVLLLGCLP